MRLIVAVLVEQAAEVVVALWEREPQPPPRDLLVRRLPLSPFCEHAFWTSFSCASSSISSCSSSFSTSLVLPWEPPPSSTQSAASALEIVVGIGARPRSFRYWQTPQQKPAARCRLIGLPPDQPAIHFSPRFFLFAFTLGAPFARPRPSI